MRRRLVGEMGLSGADRLGPSPRLRGGGHPGRLAAMPKPLFSPTHTCNVLTRRAPLAAAVGLLIAGTAALAADAYAADDERRTLPVLIHGGWKGEILQPDCANGTSGSDLPAVVGFVDAVRKEQAEHNELAPVVLHSGDLTFPGLLPRHYASMGEDGAQRFDSLIGTLGADALALGGLEFAAPPTAMRKLFGVDSDLPWLASNVHCDAAVPSDGRAPGGALCAALDRVRGADGWLTIERPGLRIAIASVLSPSHEQAIGEAQRHGLVFDPIRPTLESVAARFQAERPADLLVVIAHIATVADERELFATLEAVPGIDLVVSTPVAGGSFTDASATPAGAPVGRWISPGTRTRVVPAPSGIDQVVRVDLDLGPEGKVGEARIADANRFDVRSAAPNLDVRARLHDESEALCRAWGGAVEHAAPLAEGAPADALARWALDALRRESGAEVALFAKGSIRESAAGGSVVSAARVHETFPFDATIVRASIRGADLAAIAPHAGLRSVGLSGSGPVRVNGRPIDPDRLYAVVLDTFLAEGGDGVLDPKVLIRPRPWMSRARGLYGSLADYTLSALERGIYVDRRTGTLGGRALPDLHTKPVVRLMGDMLLGYEKVAVRNPTVLGAPGYSRPELLVQSQDAFSIDGRMELWADSRDHGLGLTASAQYATVRYPDLSPSWGELADAFSGRVSYELLAIRSAAAGHGAAPIPYVEGRLDGELTQSELRDWRYLEGFALGGLRMRPFPPLRFEIAGLVRRSYFDPAAAWLGGVTVGYAVDRMTLFRVARRPIDLESSASWTGSDPAAAKIHEIRAEARLYFQIVDHLDFAATLGAYAYRDASLDRWGHNVRVLLGIHTGFRAARQSL